MVPRASGIGRSASLAIPPLAPSRAQVHDARPRNLDRAVGVAAPVIDNRTRGSDEAAARITRGLREGERIKTDSSLGSYTEGVARRLLSDTDRCYGGRSY
jgi:hypothetical protein